MKTKKIKILFSLIAIILLTVPLVCLSFGACVNKKGSSTIHTVRNIGTFSGYRVELVRIEYADAYVNPVVVKYYVDDVYISTLPTPEYKYLVYMKEDYISLINAYQQGLVSHDDLIAIAEAEKPYDSLYDNTALRIDYMLRR